MENQVKNQMSEESSFPSSVKILAFNPEHKLAGIFLSYNHCERMSGISHQLLVRCCQGENIMTHGFYWRRLPVDIVLDSDDIGNLNMIKFDNAAGNDYKIYATKFMKKDEIIWEHEFEMKEQILKQRKHEQSKNQGDLQARLQNSEV